MDDIQQILIRPKTTARRPLLGLTILLVEDSKYCSESIRLLSIRSGARLRRADCLRAARKHLKIYRPDVVIVDMGLPDGSGVDIMRDIAKTCVPMPAIIATSGVLGGTERANAKKAGATLFMEKPVTDLAQFQQIILAGLPSDLKPSGFSPRLTGVTVTPDAQALQDDMEHIQHMLLDAEETDKTPSLRYAAQFLASLAREANSKRIQKAAKTIDGFANSGTATPENLRAQMTLIRGAVDQRLAQSVQM